MSLIKKIDGTVSSTTTTSSTSFFSNEDSSNAVSNSTLKNQGASVYVDNGYVVDSALNENSVRAVANKILTAKFDEVDQRIESIEKTGITDEQFEELANKLTTSDAAFQTEVEERKAADEQIIQDTTTSFNAVKDEMEVLDDEVQSISEKLEKYDSLIPEKADKSNVEQSITNITQIVESISGLYKSDTNASKWECGEGYFTGYLGTGSTTVFSETGLKMSPYPEIYGTYYNSTNSDNSLVTTLNLAPGITDYSLFNFTGTGSADAGRKTLALTSGWFENSENITLSLPAQSGTLITQNDAMGSLDIEVKDLDTTEIEITKEQYNYLVRYPKTKFALKERYSEIYRYFIKVQDDFESRDPTAVFITYEDHTIGIAEVKSYTDEVKSYTIQITYTELASAEKIASLEARCKTLEEDLNTLKELVNTLTNNTNTLNGNS